jgi:FtsZ-interacting cell division protein YlmF
MNSAFGALRQFVADKGIEFDAGMVERHPIKTFQLKEFAEVTEIVEFIRDGGTAIVDTSLMEEDSQRSIDFISGAAFYGGHSHKHYAENLFGFGEAEAIEAYELPEFDNVIPFPQTPNFGA